MKLAATFLRTITSSLRLLFLLTAVTPFASLVSAQSPPLFSSVANQCADPAGFRQCWANATATAQTCYGVVNRCPGSGTCTDENDCRSTNRDCSLNCVCDAYAEWMNCALSSCWNMVYSCEYQNLAANAALNCPGAGLGPKNTADVDGYLPYIPAPANAPGGCSCDISFVYYRSVTATLNGRACAARVANGTANNPAATVDRCLCCSYSEEVSAFYNTCPSTSPAVVPLWNETIADGSTLLGSAACRTGLGTGFDCRTLGFEKPGIAGGSFYNAANLPTPGNQSLSNTGNAVITSPIAGPTLLWQLGNEFPTMTAVAAAVAASSSSGSGSSGSGGGLTSGNGTSTGGATGATALLHGSFIGSRAWVFAWLLVAVAGGAIML